MGVVYPNGVVVWDRFDNPSVCFADSVSLRLGHLAVLTVPRTVIHYRSAASLPFTQGSLGAVRERPRANAVRPYFGGGTKAPPYGVSMALWDFGVCGSSKWPTPTTKVGVMP